MISRTEIYFWQNTIGSLMAGLLVCSCSGTESSDSNSHSRRSETENTNLEAYCCSFPSDDAVASSSHAGTFGERRSIEGVETISDGTQWLFNDAKENFLWFLKRLDDPAMFTYSYTTQNAPSDLFGNIWSTELRTIVWKGLDSSSDLSDLDLGRWVERDGTWVFENARYAQFFFSYGGGNVPGIPATLPAHGMRVVAGYIYVGQQWIYVDAQRYALMFPYYDADLSLFAEQIVSGQTTCRALGFDNDNFIYQRSDGAYHAYVGSACVCSLSGSTNYVDKWCVGCDCSSGAQQKASDYLFVDACIDTCPMGF